MRGAGQKIIGFSFYGNPNSTKGKERKYFKVPTVKLDLRSPTAGILKNSVETKKNTFIRLMTLWISLPPLHIDTFDN